MDSQPIKHPATFKRSNTSHLEESCRGRGVLFTVPCNLYEILDGSEGLKGELKGSFRFGGIGLNLERINHQCYLPCRAPAMRITVKAMQSQE